MKMTRDNPSKRSTAKAFSIMADLPGADKTSHRRACGSGARHRLRNALMGIGIEDGVTPAAVQASGAGCNREIGQSGLIRHIGYGGLPAQIHQRIHLRRELGWVRVAWAGV